MKQASAMKLARIWVDKRLFPERVLASIAHTFKSELSHTIPGSEELMASYPSSNDAFMPSAPTIAGQSNAYAAPSSGYNPHPPSYSAPSISNQAYPAPAPGSYPPSYSAPQNPGLSSIEDIAALGDLNSLLGLPTSAPPATQPSFYGAPPPERSGPPHGPPPHASYPPQPNSYPNRADYRHPNSQYPPQQPYNAYNRSDAPQHPPNNYGRNNGPSPSSNYGYQQNAQGYQNNGSSQPPHARQERQNREEPPIPTGPVYSNTLFVGSLPPEATESDLRETLSKFGMVKRIILKSDKGYAFVPFGTRAEAEAARAALDGQKFGDRILRIRWAKSDVYRSASVDPETGLLSFGGDSDSNQRGNGNSSPSGYNRSQDRGSHGIPRGVRPKMESSFADEPAPYNTGRPYPDEDYSRGKRRYDGDQPQAEKRRMESDGFETMTSYSGR